MKVRLNKQIYIKTEIILFQFGILFVEFGERHIKELVFFYIASNLWLIVNIQYKKLKKNNKINFAALNFYVQSTSTIIST